MGWVVNASPRPLHPKERGPVSIIHEAGWVPGPVWTGAEKLAPPPGFDSRTIQPVVSRYTDYTKVLHVTQKKSSETKFHPN